MVDIEEVYVRDLFKKYKGRPEYKGLYSIGKKIYQDNGEVHNEGFAIDEENLRILKALIEAIFIDEIKPKQGKVLRPHKPRVKITLIKYC
ncbi:MAG: hypothetical protein L0H53_08390 [Candidatus Nitrosocosmicus sp.]|nr:hypothetical protein [Candidatus Nitrosocosmicus sp.]MDN5866107.1 hypothetical protein [Candidatus Nitrosocosmicus sp.]